MLVSDIYGDNSPFKELAGDLLASSFAKVAQDPVTNMNNSEQQPEEEENKEDPRAAIRNKFHDNDVLSSLVTMISFNIGQLAYYTAKLHNCKTIYFVGNYVRNNQLGQNQICFAVDIMQGIGLTKPKQPTTGPASETNSAAQQEQVESNTEP